MAEKNAMCRCSDTTGVRRNVILVFDPIEMDLSPGDDERSFYAVLAQLPSQLEQMSSAFS